MSNLSLIIEDLKRLKEKNENRKKLTTDAAQCQHIHWIYKKETFECSDCKLKCTEKDDIYTQEKLEMNELGDNDKSDVADSINRGVTIAFLVAFCTAFDLWDISVVDTVRDYIIPMTSDTRCRFVDLPVFQQNPGVVVGRAQTFVTFSGDSKFGDLVAAISEGADTNRRVWLGFFSARQWPCGKNDWFLEYIIQRCTSLIVFCPDPPELLQISDFADLSSELMGLLPFFRTWCMYPTFFAAMSNGVSIVVKCGHHVLSNGEDGPISTFINSSDTLKALVPIIDIKKTVLKNSADSDSLAEKLKAMPTGYSDTNTMNIKLRGVLRAAAETSGDPLIHNAACGDKAAKVKVLERSEQFIHQIAIAGYFQLLTAALEQKPDLVDAIDEDTGRSLLINAVWSGFRKCVAFVAEMGARRNIIDKEGKTALSYAIEFGFSDCEKYLRRQAPPTFYIKHRQSQRYVGYEKGSYKLVLQDIYPSDFVKLNDLRVKENNFLFRFVHDELQHVQTGMFAHPYQGRKENDASIGLHEDRSSCYPLDYDPEHCLLAGGDNFFVKIDSNNGLVWQKYKGASDVNSMNNPYRAENGFEFHIIFHPPLETSENVDNDKQKTPSIQDSSEKQTHLDYQVACENIGLHEKIDERMFPMSYLVDYVAEQPPHNGKIKAIPTKNFGDKTIAKDSITQRMFLITANILEEMEFTFSKNPWEKETGCDFGDSTQLISFKFNGIESVSNSEDSKLESKQTLSIKLSEKHPYFDSIRVQCVLSLQNNPSNVKHICYLEVKA
eukprot:gene27443-36219_t